MYRSVIPSLVDNKADDQSKQKKLSLRLGLDLCCSAVYVRLSEFGHSVLWISAGLPLITHSCVTVKEKIWTL